jgi:hypothetical protein
MDESFRDFYSRERRVYEGTLEEELGKRKFEIENKRMLYYIIRELKLLFPSGINNVLDVGGGIGATLYSISQYVKISNAYSGDLYKPPEYIQKVLHNIKFVNATVYDLSKIFSENFLMLYY